MESAGTGRVARRRPPRRPRARGGAAPGGRHGRPRAPVRRRRLRPPRPRAGDGRAEPRRAAVARARRREAAAKVRLLREFDPAARGDLYVPDPYYGGRRRLRATCSTWSTRPASGCSSTCARSRRCRGDDASRVARGPGGRRRRRGGGRAVRVRRQHQPRAAGQARGRTRGCSSSTTRDAPDGHVPRRGRGPALARRSAGALRTPAVVAVGEGPGPRFLALEWIERGAGGPAADEALGRGLAALHRAGAPAFGLDADNAIGGLPQPNAPLPDLGRVLRRRRLEPHRPPRGGRGRLPASRPRAGRAPVRAAARALRPAGAAGAPARRPVGRQRDRRRGRRPGGHRSRRSTAATARSTWR